jgi:hypothetical protein
MLLAAAGQGHNSGMLLPKGVSHSSIEPSKIARVKADTVCAEAASGLHQTAVPLSRASSTLLRLPRILNSDLEEYGVRAPVITGLQTELHQRPIRHVIVDTAIKKSKKIINGAISLRKNS